VAAARNFDDLLSQERTFVVRGETFTWQDVRPEVLDTILRVSPNGDGKEGEEKEQDMWAAQDKMILEFLVPEDHERWQNLRSRDKDPVTIAQFNAILEFLVAEQTDRPTQPPSPSGSGRGKTAR
jgi:hypothetical protein